ncbi:MAG: hypothetical protein JWO39_1124 [Gemmatimonadetes bacterium]|jgi:hypothetical protein|nr:hypothetical protein [Gemmatimonadota bacterium]
MSTRGWLRGCSGLVGLVVLALAQTQRLAAQVCRPPASSNEAKTFAIFSVPLAFGPVDAPELHPRFQVGLEAAYLPKIAPATATPTICQPGKGPESTDLLFAVPRPRIGIPLPLGLALEASWIPPVRVAGVKANLFGVSLAKPFELWSLIGSVRAHSTFGSIRAPITCDQAALSDKSSECFNGKLSDDRFSPNIFGADLSLGKSIFDGRLRPYVGGGYNRLEPRLQVNFTNQSGFVDHTRVVVNLDRLALFGGATWQMDSRFAASTEVYATPADAVTVRLALRATIGP